MKYKDFEGDIEELIEIKLDEIEKTENVKILHAVESGSRAWGFESPDSDYDVRFIYVRNEEFYLRVDETDDFIDWELDEVLDINGWDIKKALKLAYKSNGTIFEWANSPVVYRTTKQWDMVYREMLKYFSEKTCMYHYYGTAKSNYMAYLQAKEVKYKKYFYVIRPLLACIWIEQNHSPAPVLFNDLKKELLKLDILDEVEKLMEVKMKMNESDKGPRIDIIDSFIENELIRIDKKLKDMKSDRKPEWLEINSVFMRLLNQY